MFNKSVLALALLTLLVFSAVPAHAVRWFKGTMNNVMILDTGHVKINMIRTDNSNNIGYLLDATVDKNQFLAVCLTALSSGKTLMMRRNDSNRWDSVYLLN